MKNSARLFLPYHKSFLPFSLLMLRSFKQLPNLLRSFKQLPNLLRSSEQLPNLPKRQTLDRSSVSQNAQFFTLITPKVVQVSLKLLFAPLRSVSVLSFVPLPPRGLFEERS